MIGITQYPFKEQPCLIQLFGNRQTRACERLYEPKRAHVESAFLAWESVNAGLRRITIYKAVANETSVPRILEDGVYGAEHPRIGRSHEEHERHDKERRVQVLAAIILGKRVAFLVPALGHHFFVDTVPFAHPLCSVGRQRTLVGQPETAIQSYPVHHF